MPMARPGSKGWPHLLGQLWGEKITLRDRRRKIQTVILGLQRPQTRWPFPHWNILAGGAMASRHTWAVEGHYILDPY